MTAAFIPLSAQYDRAFLLATNAHRCQVRKGTTIPYLAHLMTVSAIVIEHGGDEAQAIAALLHDIVEDQGGAPMLAHLRREFGDDVAELVDACTDTDVQPKPPWRERKEAYVRHLAGVPERALLVSMADKLHNARAIVRDHKVLGPAVWARFSCTAEETKWYYDQLVAAYRAREVNSPLLDELAATVSAMQQLAS